MAGSIVGEIVVGRDSPATPKRSTRPVKLSAKAKESEAEDASPVRARAPVARSTRATRATRTLSAETDHEHVETFESTQDRADGAEALLRRVLDELKDIKNASTQQQDLILKLQDQVTEAQREIRETKDELKCVREQLEAVTAATPSSDSARASYAEVARTPPGSQPSNVRTLSSGNTTLASINSTLYCTIDTSRVEQEATEQFSAGTIRAMVEEGVREEQHNPTWRCLAVTQTPRNQHRIRIACRNEGEHQMVKKVIEGKIARGARLLRDDLYPIKVDGVIRRAALDEAGNDKAGAAEELGKENEVQVARVKWISSREASKEYGSIVVHLTKAADAQHFLREGYFYAGGLSGQTRVYERRESPEQCYNCQEITKHKAYQCTKPQVCARCAKAGHRHSECTEAILKCVPCGGPHESFSKNCRKLYPSRHE